MLVTSVSTHLLLLLATHLSFATITFHLSYQRMLLGMFDLTLADHLYRSSIHDRLVPHIPLILQTRG